MPVLYTRECGRDSDITLWVDDYLAALDSNTLDPFTASFGYKTHIPWSDVGHFADITAEEYLDAFRYWSEHNSVMATPARRPSLLINGLPSVSEDGPITNSTTLTAKPGTLSATASPQRDAAKLNMLRRMRPPPFQYAWTFWHDKHSEASSYDNRLTILLENIITLKPFWEAYNRFPLDALKMKDSVHFFKRGVKPVWEDPRNIRGGSWTFRVPKDKSEETWKEILLLTVGEQFADVIQPRDDLCGVSLSVRFNNNLISIWTRDGDNRATIDGILATVLDKISPEIRPKEGSYYYKKHSEHAGFREVVAKTQGMAVVDSVLKEPKTGEILISGKIEEAKVQEGEVERQIREEEAAEEEEARKRSRAMTVG